MNKIPNIKMRGIAGFSDLRFRIWSLIRISGFGFRISYRPTLLAILLLACSSAVAGETIPTSPSPHYIVDQAHVLSPASLQSIDEQLQQFERDTSDQIVVGIYPTMQSDDDIAAYAVRVFQAWHIGQKGKDNGALLLAFIQDHKLNIATGYGLEGALPDATCKQIVDEEIAPHFKSGDYDGGIKAGVNAMLAATRGEYKGNGTTHLDQGPASSFQLLPTLFVIFIALLVLSGILRSIYGTAYSSGGRMPGWVVPFILFSNMTSSGRGGVWSGGGGDWGGGGGSGGGFSGGGGSTGGGGASGSW
jgi:uncharacterized protein